MKKKLSIIITLAFAAVVTLSAGAFAYGGGKTGHHMGKKRMHMDRQAPESRYESMWNALSPEQQDQLKALHQNFIDKTASKKMELTAKKTNMSILLNTSSPDAAELKKLAGEIADLKAEIMEKRIDFMLNAKKVAPDFRFGPNAGFGGMNHGKRGYSAKGSGMNYHGSMHRGGFERGPGAGCWR
jgi:zinc resistance-associated protein